MSGLLEVRGLTVDLPTGAGWARPANEVSLHISDLVSNEEGLPDVQEAFLYDFVSL